MTTAEALSAEVLSSHYCLETVDRVARQPAVAAFKRRARLQQALWREERGIPIGSQPMRPKEGQKSRPLGSRIDLGYALETGANFLSDSARECARRRVAHPEPHQTLDVDRLYSDLLSSMPMCFNLFGELAADLDLADEAVHAWWPDVPGRVSAVRFEWSPGRRLAGEYLENRSAFDVAFELDLGRGRLGVLGVETKYHEDCRREKPPSDYRRTRYEYVSRSRGVLSRDRIYDILGTDLQQIWLDHLLAESMLLHESKRWTWAGFVLVHPGRNPSYAAATDRYRRLLETGADIRVNTLEELLEADVLPDVMAAEFAKRYLW
ncbi:MAG: hypothetical protein R3D98_06500 [Candidatus Krumholzibacteriia bacterium]